MPLKTACGGVARRVRRADDRFCGVAGQILVPQPLVFGLLKAFPSRAIDWDTYGPVFCKIVWISRCFGRLTVKKPCSRLLNFINTPESIVCDRIAASGRGGNQRALSAALPGVFGGFGLCSAPFFAWYRSNATKRHRPRAATSGSVGRAWPYGPDRIGTRSTGRNRFVE